MPYSFVTLFYGLWVKTWSLAFAAGAHAKIKPALVAIDLISLRRRQEKLVAEAQDSKTTVRDLPDEVWELVKQELIDEALWDEELAALTKYRCGACSNAAGEGSNSWSIDSFTLEEGPMWKRWGWPSCQWCYDGLEFKDRMDWFGSPEQVKTAEQLLAPFGLYLLEVAAWRDEPSDDWNDFDELSAIAIPLQATKQGLQVSLPSPVITNYAPSYSNGYDLFPDSNTLACSPEALALPSNAELRFRRLISTYRLQVVDRVTSTIIPPPPISASTETHNSQPDTKKDQREKAEFGKEQPRWMLWSLAGPWD